MTHSPWLTEPLRNALNEPETSGVLQPLLDADFGDPRGWSDLQREAFIETAATALGPIFEHIVREDVAEAGRLRSRVDAACNRISARAAAEVRAAFHEPYGSRTNP